MVENDAAITTTIPPPQNTTQVEALHCS